MQRNTKLGRILRHWIIGKYESREEEVYQSFYIYVSFLLERVEEFPEKAIKEVYVQNARPMMLWFKSWNQREKVPSAENNLYYTDNIQVKLYPSTHEFVA